MTSKKAFLFQKEYSLRLYVLFPAISMLLGWGLRGFIGGGPFGAMIPGAMVMLAICMLLDIPYAKSAVMVVFGTVGIGIGGEMTYGQTLGFLRNPDTIWWGTCGTTLKGGIWGLVGGVFIGLGLIYRRIQSKIIILGLLLFLIGLIIGMKLINDPKLLYFSDPFNKPRDESWAGLLFGAIFLLGWLKIKLPKDEFRLIYRFACWGLIGGALGFGLGAFWLVVGNQHGTGFFVTDWWKLMEFSFGFILGGFLGYASWLSRNEITKDDRPATSAVTGVPVFKELGIALMIGFFIYLIVPLFEPFVEAAGSADSFLVSALRTFMRVVINYSFLGSLLILAALRWPFVAFQIAVTLTFSHTVFDLADDFSAKHEHLYPPVVTAAIVLLTSLVIGFLVAAFQRRANNLKSMFLLLVWSTVGVAVIRMLLNSEFDFAPEHSLLQVILGDMLVFNVFIISAIIISWMTINLIDAHSASGKIK